MDVCLQAAKVYSKIAQVYASNFDSPAEHIDEFLKLMKKNSPILDVGCGYGRNAYYMASRGFKVIGIDLSDEMIKLAKGSFPHIDFRLQDMRKLAFKPSSVDGVFASYSLIHLPKSDISLVLQLFNRFLTEDGVLYISLQMGRSQEIYAKVPVEQEETIFLNVFSLNEIIGLLEKFGFSITRQYDRPPKRLEYNFQKLYILAHKYSGQNYSIK